MNLVRRRLGQRIIWPMSVLFLLNIPIEGWSKDKVSYFLGPGDVVKIFVWEHPELSGEITVDPAGNIPFLLLGDVMAEGLTEEELEEVLTEGLSRYIMNPNISVTIIGYNSKKIYILGEVNRPGEYSIGGGVISLKKSIVKAGLPTSSAALRRVRIITPQTTKPIVKIVNLDAVLNKGNLKEDIDLRAGDIVYIPSNIPTKIGNVLDKLTSPLSKILVFFGLVGRI
ncbi:MAG: polysaccharide biosynthesis/export family protein [bacterium]|nr:polysaccharide biosynthesis/export family protein [bacterium]